jgi:hypothetical protein
VRPGLAHADVLPLPADVLPTPIKRLLQVHH